mmetsp:Transcript_22160/g.22328  ORF Transcript_22160/g.22328 Transcript_22160/m.22328 type:complete len:246 (+) Transcript_22160:181-918(+)|eukprot:CAMPEP_0182424770 /NCGR_PEP_ID=MMETSP1167-20130531/11035_1 /TAXON_ID=2988 /ORGANISM="Mallomonas Sp, Strain CCMP3275" /LENGTH=245 /DNA_ID=CAMNT_0024604837 /DNA_START=41 /DNA_END=778 /DNA_ORIENTATION=+
MERKSSTTRINTAKAEGKSMKFSKDVDDDYIAAKPLNLSPNKASSKTDDDYDSEADDKLSKDIDDSIDGNDEVEEEFNSYFRRGHQPPDLPPADIVSPNPRANDIIDGFSINWMNMRDGDTGKLLWQSQDWADKLYGTELEARVPKSILKCKTVSREINFTSKEMIENFRLEQRVLYRGICIEEWFFKFGFVIPGSTNTWQQVIEAAAAEDMLTAEELSGNVMFETSFYDNEMFICKNLFRIYYV